MDGVEVIRVVKVIGCTKLTNQLIVPWLVKFQQLIKPHGAQVMNDLLEFLLQKLTKIVSINELYQNDYRLMFVDVLEIDQMVIKVKMKAVPKVVLNPKILGLTIEGAGTLIPYIGHFVEIVNW